MTDSNKLRSVTKVRVYCPILAETFSAVALGRLDAIETDPNAEAILGLIRAENELGDFGLYRGVFEVSLGLEGFTPTEAAAPTLGASGGNTLSHTASITTFAPADLPMPRLEALLSEMARAHPWEIPVIEVCRGGEVSLFGA